MMARGPAALVVVLAILAGPAAAIDRAEVMDRARAFALHPWTCSAQNRTAPCTNSYSSDFPIGDHLGLPYDWGGFVSLHGFSEDIDAGQGAGTPVLAEPLSCTTGLDCSGYVSQCWDLPHKYGTWTILEVATVIDRTDLTAGDALNEAGYHIVLFAQELADGTLIYYEALWPNVHLNWYSSWSGVNGFDAIRLDAIEPADPDLGSLSNPIPITFPYQDNSRNTANSPSDLLDACGAAPGTDESGREYIYSLTIDQPGHLSATVSDGMGVDIDVHLYAHRAERDCIARDDDNLELDLTACGTYLLVLDTWVNAAGSELAGPYTLTVDFTPTGGPCGSLPDYDYLGGPGDACAYPDDPDLAFCNPNLDVLTCLYASGPSGFSFCSRACDAAADCADGFPAGCCEPVSGGATYCFPEEHCPGVEPDGGDVDGGDVDGGVEDGGIEDGGIEDGGIEDGGIEDGGIEDGGVEDGGVEDGGVEDGGVEDGGVEDGGVEDGGVEDGGVEDGGVEDGGVEDGGVEDGGVEDGGIEDGGVEDGGVEDGADQSQPADEPLCPPGYRPFEEGCVPDDWREPDAGGCGCAAPAGGRRASALLAIALLGWLMRRRRS